MEKTILLFLYLLPGFLLMLAVRYKPPRVSLIEFILVSFLCSVTLNVVAAAFQTALFGQISRTQLISSVLLANFVCLVFVFLTVVRRLVMLLLIRKS